MTYTEKAPSDKFKELVHTYWRFEISEDFNNGSPFLFEIMPEHTVSIVFVNLPHFKRTNLLGVQTKRMKRQILPGSVFFGIRFNPWVCIEGMLENKIATTNDTVEVPELLDELFAEIKPRSMSADLSDVQVIEKSLSNLANHYKITSDPLVKYICLQLENGTKINEFIQEVPLSIRPVQKRFKNITGMTMVEFRNISRLRNTVKQIYTQQENITNAAFENGYADHSHFMNTFKTHMEGTTVKNFLAQTETISHRF